MLDSRVTEISRKEVMPDIFLKVRVFVLRYLSLRKGGKLCHAMSP